MEDDFLDLIKALEDIKARQATLTRSENEIKEQLMKVMKANNIEKHNTDYGNVRIQRRYEKDYGDDIRTMEVQLKEAKKLADDMGAVSVLGFKESLVFTPPAVPF